MTTLRKRKNKIQEANRLHSYDFTIGRKTDNLSKVIDMNFGKERRSLIEKVLAENSVVVNRAHCAILRFDPDLRKMLKQGKIIRYREPGGGRCNYTKITLK